EVGLGLSERRGELRRRRVAELGAGEAELLFAGLDGVIGLHERRRGAAGEFLERERGGTLAARCAGGASLAAGADDEPDDRTDHDDKEADEEDGAESAALAWCAALALCAAADRV